MSYTDDLLDGLAVWTAAAGIGTYRPDGTAFLASETGITLKNLPPDPDRIIALATYGANSDHPVIPLGRQPVQVRCRGTSDPRDVDALADAVFALWHGATNLNFGSCHVIQILRESSIGLGMDDQSRRWERADNFYLDVSVPVTANRPG